MKDFYRARMNEGYKLHEVDEMDIKFYLELIQQDIEYITADDIPWL